MTTRRGEPHQVEAQTIADILRPLVEATVECPVCHGLGEEVFIEPDRTLGHPCPPTVADPRFEALRCSHEGTAYELDSPYCLCSRCGLTDLHDVRDLRNWPPGINASLGAIVRAAAACDLTITLGRGLLEGMWWAVVADPEDARHRHHREGATPEEALARALVAAWRGE